MTKKDLKGNFTAPTKKKLPEPKRTPVDDAQVAAFERGEGKAASAAVRSTKRRRSERGERTVVYLPADVDERLRLRCAKDKRSISDAVTRALQLWLAQEE